MKQILSVLKKQETPIWVKIIIFVLIIILYGSFLFSKINLPGALDLPRQIQNGKDILSGNFDVLTKNVYSYIEPDQPFANHHWLFGVESYILYKNFGWIGLDLIKIIIMLVTFILLFYLALKRSDFWLVIFFSIPTIFILISRTAFRPELLSYLFVCIFLLLLFDLQDNPHKNRIFWLVPIMLLWVNTHLFFPIGIMLVGGFLFEKIILNLKELRSNVLVKKLTLLLSLLVVTIFINPYGLMGVVHSLTVNTAKDFPIYSMEVSNIFRALRLDPSWANISIYTYLILATLLLTSFVIVFIYRVKKRQPLFKNNFIFLFLASVGSTGLSYFIFRALPLFGAIFLLSICYIGNDFFILFRSWVKNQNKTIYIALRYILITILSIIIVFLVFLGQRKIMQYREQGLGLSRDAASSIDFFREQGLVGPVFNDTDSGSYLIGGLYPQEKVFADNRFGDAYSRSFFSDIYLPMLQDENSWKEGLAKYNINTIFMYHYDLGDGARDFIFRRIYDPDWVWVYVDKNNVILVRNILENKEVIDKFRITPENIDERLSSLIKSSRAKDKLNAADIFNLIGQTKKSIPLYLQYLSLRPGDGEIWFILGRTELRKVDQSNSNPSLAVIFLQNAIDNGWVTWESYSYLALAYYRIGDMEQVKSAVKKELKISPNGNDAQKWVKIINDEEMKLNNEN